MNNRMYEICGNCGKRYGLHIDISCPDDFNSAFEPTGKYEGENMNNRIQLTEEYAREILDECACTETCDFKIDETISVMKQKGYIIKSELQQKVEEAINLFDHCFNDLLYNSHVKLSNNQLVILKSAFIALKQSHPEFKK